MRCEEHSNVLKPSEIHGFYLVYKKTRKYLVTKVSITSLNIIDMRLAEKKNTLIFRCDFNGVITDEPTVMTAGQEARRVALNVRNWQKHQNVQLPL